jgi:O-antigen/teichoic acid export membrane protein
MNTLRTNIVANYIGTVWISLLSLLLIPFYLRVLGPEGYGLVGFFLAFRASLAILDFGLSAYSTREVARRLVNITSKPKLEPYVSTIEVVYWIVGILLFLIFGLAAFFFPTAWFKLNKLLPNVIQTSQFIFAITLGISWPISFYRGILRGLERQVEYNYVAVFASTFRAIASLIVLLFISPTVIAFFYVQMVSSLIEVILMRKMVWRSIRIMGSCNNSYVKFKFKELIAAWRGILGISAVSILGVLIAQADKLIISRQFPLEELGYYTIAVTLAVSTSRLVHSVIVAIFPKFAASHIRNKHKIMEKIYEISSEFVILIYLPVIVCSIYFSEQLLFMWTKSELASIKAGEVLAFLIVAQLFAQLFNISSNFQFAAGKIKLLILINLITFFIYLPILFFSIENFGIKGAAISWFLVNFVVCIFLGSRIRKKAVNKIMTYQWFLKIFLITTSILLLPAILKSVNLLPLVNLMILLVIFLIYYIWLAIKMWSLFPVKLSEN